MENNINELKTSINNGAEYFKAYIQKKFLEGISAKQFDEIIGYLEDLPESVPELSLELSEILLDIIPQNDQTDPSFVGMAWHFRILALLYRPEPEILLKSISQALSFIESEPVNSGCGWMICKNAQAMLTPDILGEDNLLLLYKRCAAFFKAIGEYEEAVAFILYAVTTFSKHGAYQSADRLLMDAKEISERSGQVQLEAKVGFALAQAAVDQHDHERAELIFETIFEDFQSKNLNVPDMQVFNLGVVKMRLEKTHDAIKIFAELNNDLLPDSSLSFICRFHLAICQKDLGNFTAAEKMIDTLNSESEQISIAIDECFNSDGNELLIEYNLVGALILAKNGKYFESGLMLNKSFRRIEFALDLTVRPHYRKRIRSQYNNRILQVIALIWENSITSDLLPVIAGLKKNSQSDWLSILGWVEYVMGHQVVNTADKSKLEGILDRLRKHSGMTIGPYQEKYDDPFEWAGRTDELLVETGGSASNLPWQDFAFFSAKLINRYRLEPVFFLSSLSTLKQSLTQKLLDGKALVFIFTTIEGFTNYVFNDKSIFKESFEVHHFRRYREALINYRGNKIDWTEFARPFTSIVGFIDEELRIIWDQISLESRTGILIFSGISDAYFPLPQACLSNKNILQRLGIGDFTFSQCPIMFCQQPVNRELETINILLNQHHQLGLFMPEALGVAANFSQSKIHSVHNDNDVMNVLGEVSESDLVHIISHGTPISTFANPFFASLAGGTFSLGALKLLHDSKSQLYFIAACNAADTSNPSSGVIIPTNEIIGYITVLMQNRMAKVIACKWPILDKLGFVFSILFYRYLAESGDINKAYGQTIHKLATESKDFFLPMLELIEPSTAREKLKNELNSEDNPFDLEFYFTAMNLYTLL